MLRSSRSRAGVSLVSLSLSHCIPAGSKSTRVGSFSSCSPWSFLSLLFRLIISYILYPSHAVQATNAIETATQKPVAAVAHAAARRLPPNAATAPVNALAIVLENCLNTVCPSFLLRALSEGETAFETISAHFFATHFPFFHRATAPFGRIRAIGLPAFDSRSIPLFFTNRIAATHLSVAPPAWIAGLTIHLAVL